MLISVYGVGNAHYMGRGRTNLHIGSLEARLLGIQQGARVWVGSPKSHYIVTSLIIRMWTYMTGAPVANEGATFWCIVWNGKHHWIILKNLLRMWSLSWSNTYIRVGTWQGLWLRSSTKNTCDTKRLDHALTKLRVQQISQMEGPM